MKEKLVFFGYKFSSYQDLVDQILDECCQSGDLLLEQIMEMKHRDWQLTLCKVPREKKGKINLVQESHDGSMAGNYFLAKNVVPIFFCNNMK
ncbi:hypothetical protein K1719_025016 [Acacia pycnantha]|nr:hypothetical protein K1719_025016 [Acacia pycnantha]